MVVDNNTVFQALLDMDKVDVTSSFIVTGINLNIPYIVLLRVLQVPYS